LIIIFNMNQDNNLIYFLTDRMTKGKIYPPQELAEKMSRQKVGGFWSALVDQLKRGQHPGHQFGLYLHFPFCPSKCRFCYCFSDQICDQTLIEKYLKEMIKEMEFFSEILADLPVKTIYVGGGTPSYLSSDQLGNIFENLLAKFRLDKADYQFNFEASPYTLDNKKLDLLKELGVNRLSMGVQSLDAKVLNNIKRPQNYGMIKNNVDYAREIGIKHINLDYVAGLPGETLASFLKGFSSLIKLRPDIIHLYKFYPADNSIFHKEGLVYDQQAVLLRDKMIKLGEKIVAKEGYLSIRNEFEAWGLEFSARNRQDAERKEKPYSVLGLGAYAKSAVFANLRYQNSANHYFKETEYFGCPLNEDEEMRNFIISAGRGGFSLTEFKEIFKQDPLAVFNDQFAFLQNNDYFLQNGDHLEIRTPDSNTFHFLMKKLFYPSKTIEQLKDFYKQEYDPTINYEEVLSAKINDNF